VCPAGEWSFDRILLRTTVTVEPRCHRKEGIMGPASKEGPNREKPDVFAHRLIDIINDGALALLISLGYRTGLFDVMAQLPRSTAQEIADAAQLSEPYARKWLEGMVKGGIVSQDPISGSYDLPLEHAVHLLGASSKNLSALAGFVPLLGAAEDQIVERFQASGHTPYDARPSFRQMISKAAHESDRAVVATLVEAILPLVPGLVDALRDGIEVLDIHCGSGRAINLMASTFPKSRFHGYDLFERHIDRAEWGAFRLGLTNILFHVKDVADMDEPGHYDLITDFDTLRDETRPRHVLENLARALRSGGTFLMQEVLVSSKVGERFGLPQDSPLVYAESLAEMHEGRGSPRGEQEVRSLLLESGFESVAVHRLPHHIYNCYFVATKGG
jgi:SAM-dependent methyltransferase